MPLMSWSKFISLQFSARPATSAEVVPRFCTLVAKRMVKGVCACLVAVAINSASSSSGFAARLSEQLRNEELGDGLRTNETDILPKSVIPDEQEFQDRAQQKAVISNDLSKLPEPVANLRLQLLEAAKNGDLVALGKIFETNRKQVLLGFDGPAEDPIAYWRASSTDGEGLETLAIMIEILSTDYAHVGIGTDTERYVWPYLAEIPLENLNTKQLIDMYKLVSHGDFEDMKAFGGYFFFRLGIEPDGTWTYFLSGD